MYAVYNAFIYLVWFLATFYTILILLTLLFYRKNIFENKKMSRKNRPFVSLLVPAYNEEDSISDTIRSLKKVSYRNVEFIILNDGSKDRTSEVIRREIGSDPRFMFVDNRKNKGKAAMLNKGIRLAKGEFIACMDADSVIERDIIQKALPYFDDGKVGAVTVSVEVKKPRTVLEKMIAMEYTLGLSLFLKVYSFLDCIFVTPGPFSVYRADVLRKVGGFDETNITEDLEIAYKIHKANYKIRNCIEAKVHTKLPEGFRRIYIQRRRWYSGALNTLIQHRDVIFNRKHGLFGFFMPYNYFLILLGLGVFIASVYIFIAKIVRNIIYFQYTGFNFLDHIKFSHDLLAYGGINLLGMSMFPLTVLVMIIGFVTVRRKFRENRIGLLSYPFMFFIYQIFWAGSILAVIRRRKLKWR
jgi:peptidoglycan-N-acetylglucosamine deacetylase